MNGVIQYSPVCVKINRNKSTSVTIFPSFKKKSIKRIWFKSSIKLKKGIKEFLINSTNYIWIPIRNKTTVFYVIDTKAVSVYLSSEICMKCNTSCRSLYKSYKKYFFNLNKIWIQTGRKKVHLTETNEIALRLITNACNCWKTFDQKYSNKIFTTTITQMLLIIPYI